MQKPNANHKWFRSLIVEAKRMLGLVLLILHIIKFIRDLF